MKKISLYVILTLAISLLFCSVLIEAAEPKSGGTLKVAITAFPPDYDPPMCQSSASRVVTHQVFEGLVVHNGNFKIVPMLAKSWDVSEDGTTYTFYLRKGVKFHNGTEMTAEDVIASIDRARKVSYNVMGIEQIKNMYAKDNYTVVIELEQLNAAFLQRLATERNPIAIMPKEVIENVPGRDLDEVDELVGTGPFKYEEIVADQYIKLTRFEDYTPYQDMPASGRAGNKIAYVDEVIIYPVPEESTSLAGLETGQYDIARDLSTDVYPRVENNPMLKEEVLKPGYILILMFNTEKGLMTDQKLRRAVQHGLSSEEILMAVRGNKKFYELQGGMFAKSQVWYSDVGLEHYNLADIEEAKNMVEDLGYKGKEVRIVTTKDISIFYQASVIVADQLQKIGLKPKINVVDWPTNVEKFTTDHSDWELSFTYYSVRAGVSGYKETFCGSIQPYNSEEMNDLFDKMETTIDFDKRYEYTKQFQNIVMNDIPVYNIGRFYSLDAYRSNVHGYETWNGMPMFYNVWKD